MRTSEPGRHFSSIGISHFSACCYQGLKSLAGAGLQKNKDDGNDSPDSTWREINFIVLLLEIGRGEHPLFMQ